MNQRIEKERERVMRSQNFMKPNLIDLTTNVEENKMKTSY
jgi:hypothetical protein